jgi:eukaryotic-like serine/threonine-protein kinase
MPIRPEDFQTGGALQGAVAASLVRQRQAASELATGEHVGIYRVLREIGRGGMAIVYLAERDDGEYEQHVALKWMQSADADPVAEALFRRERQALADLRHPNIARLLDGGRSRDGRPWFAMEFVDGEPLDRHCVVNSVAPARRLQLFLQVCGAVAFAHARGVIHRDIKPSNVLVDSDGSARLLDFGIAQLLGQDDLAGRAYTPGFASPEQQRGEAVTVTSDVYQLGRLLASLSSATQEERETLLQAGGSAPGPLHAQASQAALPRNLGADLAAVITRACALDAARRYDTVHALAADVQALLERRPVTARPRRVGYLAARYVQRHPVAVTLGALALTSLVLGTAFFTTRLASQRDLAAAEAQRAETVSGFLVELFRDGDPTRAIDPNMTARQLVQRGVDRALSNASLPPSTRNELFATLADIQISLGDNTQADQLLAGLDADAIAPKRLALMRANLSGNRGQYADAIVQFERALALDPSPSIRLQLARAQLDAGDTETARRGFDAMLAQFDTLPPPLQASTLLNAGVLAWRQGRAGDAEAFYRRALDLRDAGGNIRSESAVRINLTLALIDLTRLDDALHELDLAEQSLSRVPNLGHSQLVLQQRGIVHFRRADFDAARAAWSEQMRLTADGVNPGGNASAMHNIATTFGPEETHAALDYFLRAATARDALGDEPGALSSRLNAAFKLADLDRGDAALALARACEDKARSLSRPDLQLRAIMARAKVSRLAADGAALAALDEALSLARTQQNLMKRLDLYEDRVQAALQSQRDDVLHATVTAFLADAAQAPQAQVQERIDTMQAFDAPDAAAALLRSAEKSQQRPAVVFAIEWSLARGAAEDAGRALAQLEPQPVAPYWRLVERIAQQRGDRRAALEARAQLQRLRESGDEVLARHAPLVEPAAAKPANAAP